MSAREEIEGRLLTTGFDVIEAYPTYSETDKAWSDRLALVTRKAIGISDSSVQITSKPRRTNWRCIVGNMNTKRIDIKLRVEILTAGMHNMRMSTIIVW